MPRKTFTIECEKCGAIRTSRAKNTKYCRVCSLLRQVEYYSRAERKCLAEGCGNEYMPLQRSDKMCGKCYESTSTKVFLGECSFCNRENVPLEDPNITVCYPCMKSPATRRLLIKALQEKQRRLKSGEVEYRNVDSSEYIDRTVELEIKNAPII